MWWRCASAGAYRTGSRQASIAIVSVISQQARVGGGVRRSNGMYLAHITIASGLALSARWHELHTNLPPFSDRSFFR